MADTLSEQTRGSAGTDGIEGTVGVAEGQGARCVSALATRAHRAESAKRA